MGHVAVETDMSSSLFAVLKIGDINEFRFISLMSVIFTEILVELNGLYGTAASEIVLTVYKRNDVLEGLNLVYEL